MSIWEWLGLVLGIISLVLAITITHSSLNYFTSGLLIGQVIGAIPFRRDI